MEVSATKPLISSEVYSASNHMTIRVDSLYSLPEPWQPTNNQTHHFNATMSVPLSDNVDIVVAAGAGVIRPPPDKNVVNITFL